jgi:hypothetical protein
MKVQIDLDVQGVSNKIERNVQRVQIALDNQVLKDSNYYAPQDVGTLIDSGINFTQPGSGEVEWSTPYVRMQYYEAPNKSTDKNPNARMKWFEAAKAEKLSIWEKIANDEYNK